MSGGEFGKQIRKTRDSHDKGRFGIGQRGGTASLRRQRQLRRCFDKSERAARPLQSMQIGMKRGGIGIGTSPDVRCHLVDFGFKLHHQPGKRRNAEQSHQIDDAIGIEQRRRRIRERQRRIDFWPAIHGPAVSLAYRLAAAMP